MQKTYMKFIFHYFIIIYFSASPPFIPPTPKYGKKNFDHWLLFQHGFYLVLLKFVINYTNSSFWNSKIPLFTSKYPFIKEIMKHMVLTNKMF